MSKDTTGVDEGITDASTGKVHNGDTVSGEKDVVGLQVVMNEAKGELIEPGQTMRPIDQYSAQLIAIEPLLALHKKERFQQMIPHRQDRQTRGQRTPMEPALCRFGIAGHDGRRSGPHWKPAEISRL